jgi:hypothetical protein
MRVGKTNGIKALIGGALLVAAVGTGTPSWAQDHITTSLTAVQECLCAQRAVSILTQRVRAAKRRYAEMQDQADAMSRQVEDARSRVNTENREDIEAFRGLLARRDAAAQSFRGENQRYAAMVARYNAAVADNNAACTGRLFDQEEVEAVKSTLVCPRP